MNEFQLRLIAEGLVVNDNKKAEVIKKLVSSNFDLNTINTYENIINELFTINDYEKAFGCKLTPIRSEKNLDELEAENERLNAIKQVSDEAANDVDNYIFLSKFRTSNHLARITCSLEKMNPLFLELYSVLVERHDVMSNIDKYEFKDKQFINNFYSNLKNNEFANITK